MAAAVGRRAPAPCRLTVPAVTRPVVYPPLTALSAPGRPPTHPLVSLDCRLKAGCRTPMMGYRPTMAARASAEVRRSPPVSHPHTYLFENGYRTSQLGGISVISFCLPPA